MQTHHVGDDEVSIPKLNKNTHSSASGSGSTAEKWNFKAV